MNDELHTLETMGTAALLRLKDTWYTDAVYNNHIETIRQLTVIVGKTKGKNDVGPAFTLQYKQVEVYLMTFSGNMNVFYKGNLVCDTHNKLFVPGTWVKELLDLKVNVDNIEGSHAKIEIEKERLALVQQLTIWG